MFKNNKPIFEFGKVLKIDMLEEVRDYSRDYLDIRYKNYTNGIIEGCTIEVDDNYITVSDGIIKFNNKLYFLKDAERVKYTNTNEFVMLKVVFEDTKVEDGFEINNTKLLLNADMNLAFNEIELCRFKLRVGARLRNDHVDFVDLNTEFDTINTVNCIYAGRGQQCLSPHITEAFGNELIKLSIENPWDINFATTCLQSHYPIQREIVMGYLRNKINIGDRDYSNLDLYNYLLQVLNTMKNTGEVSFGGGRNRSRRILID